MSFEVEFWQNRYMQSQDRVRDLERSLAKYVEKCSRLMRENEELRNERR